MPDNNIMESVDEANILANISELVFAPRKLKA
jgi:hypothetical protein